MKDLEIRNVQPIVERRTPEKVAPADKSTGEAFSKELQTAVSKGEAGSIESRIKAVNEAFARQDQQIRELQTTQQSLSRMFLEMRMKNSKPEQKG
jgi:hypothetical protein